MRSFIYKIFVNEDLICFIVWRALQAFVAGILWHHNGGHQRFAYCSLLASTLIWWIYGSCPIFRRLSATLAGDLRTRLRAQRSVRELHSRVSRNSPPVAHTVRVFLHLRRHHADRHSNWDPTACVLSVLPHRAVLLQLFPSTSMLFGSTRYPLVFRSLDNYSLKFTDFLLTSDDWNRLLIPCIRLPNNLQYI